MKITWTKTLACGLLATGLIATSQASTHDMLLQQLDQDIEQLQSVIRLTGLRIELEPDTSASFDAADPLNFESTSPGAANRQALQTYFDSLKLHARIAYPYHIVTIERETQKLQSLLGQDNFYFMEHADMAPRFRPAQVEYLDGTRAAVADDYISKRTIAEKIQAEDATAIEAYLEKAPTMEKWIWQESDSFRELFALSTPKPITSITYDIALPLRKTRLEYASAAGDTLDSAAGEIKLLAIAGNKISYQLPAALAEQVAVNGLYQDGRPLKARSSNRATLYSEKKVNDLQQALVELQTARDRVKRGRIVTQEALVQYLEPRFAKLPGLQEQEQYQQVSVTYAGPVSKVAFAVPESDVQPQRFTSTYRLNIPAAETQYQVASDLATGKQGIIGNDGNWKVQPNMNEHFRMLNTRYFTDQFNDRENYYHFDPASNRLQKVNYVLSDIDVYLDRYVTIQPRTNGPNGLAELSTGKVVLPMEYETLNLQDKQAWIVRKNNKEGAFDARLRPVLPLRFDSVSFEQGFFYARQGDNEAIYDSKGRKITRGTFSRLERFSEGLVLASVSKVDNNGITRERDYFLDKQGKVAIDLAARGFSRAEVFRNGLAAVRDAKTEQWGFINPAGKLVLPAKYQDVAFGFFKVSGYAPVQLADGTTALIDKQGKVIKTFASSFNVVSYEGDNKHQHMQVEGVWYDAFGNPSHEQQ